MRPLVVRNDLVWERYRAELAEWLALEPSEKKKHHRPVDPRIYAGDATGLPGCVRLEQRRDMGRVLHEMSQTLQKTQGGRERQALIDLGFLLQLWSGNGVSYIRVGGGKGARQRR